MAPTRFPFAIVCLISVCLLFNTVNTQCCCGSGYRLNIPADVVDECLYQHDYFTDQWSQEYNGYASLNDACGSGCFCINGECNSLDFDWEPFWQDIYTVSHNGQSISNGCGNTVSIDRGWSFCGFTSVQNIDIVDTIRPELFVPPARNQECVSTNGLAGPEFDISELDNYFGSARATDLCTNPILSESISFISSSPCNYQITRVFTADDQCTTPSTSTQDVAFVDSSPPVIFSTSGGSILTFTCDQTASYAPVNVQPTATDSCDNLNGATPSSLSEIRYDGRCSGDYSIERTWTVSDQCGNQAFYLQTIVVEDPDAPLVSRNGGAFIAPVNNYVESSCTIPAPATYVLQDNCDASVRGPTYLSYEETTTGVNELEAHFDVIRTYRATDDCGNYVEWQDVVNVTRGSQQYALSAPAEIQTTKGNVAGIPITYIFLEVTCSDSYLVFDIGAAEFVSITLPNCSNGNGGNIYCPITAPISVNFAVTLTIFVPTSYAPDFLEVRQTEASSSPFEHISSNFGTRTIIQFA